MVARREILGEFFYERKTGQGLVVEELFKILTEQGNQTAVISQKVTVSGFGGVGKTTIAKWYARHYEESYDYIIWIDCGEGSLIKSFIELSVDLKVEQRSESDLKKLSRVCFQALEDNKCLFIFDNAERYIGCDGIKDTLPKNEKFHSIITSRNREWGSDSGYGQIPQLPLDLFSTDESIRFLKTNLKQKSIQEDLKELCKLLGNLPLALQIATSTLNKHTVEFAYYLEIIRRTDQIIEKNFDDYEKTINTTLTASLATIKQGDDNLSQLAYRLLLVFGYIQPDNIPIDFFEAVEHCESWEIQAGMDLLESYFLVSIERKMHDNEIIDYKYSIHRLLQQVIRFNGKGSEETTLKKILTCEGFTDFKLLPYTFAAESLKKEFPKLRAELVDQVKLPGLIHSRQFDEARRLSGIIHEDLQTSASRFNHAICLKNCKLLEESLSHLRELITYVSDSMAVSESELLPLHKEPTKRMIGSQIFLINMLEGNVTSAKEIFQQISNIFLQTTDETQSCIIQAFNSQLCGNSGYRLSITENNICLEMHNVRDVLIRGCRVDNSILKWRNLKVLRLESAIFTSEQSKSLITGNFFPPKLTHLEMKIPQSKKIYGSEIPFDRRICLNQLEYLQTLDLRYCIIALTTVPLPMSLLRSLFLERVVFHRNGEMLHEVVLSDLINFCSLKTLRLSLYGTKERWILDMSGNLNLDVVRLEGKSVVCQNWDDANWTIDLLNLDNVELRSNRMKVKDLELEGKSSLVLSDLPNTIQSLTLGCEVSFVRKSQDCFLQNLKYLNIKSGIISGIDVHGLLDKCPNLVGLKLDYVFKEIKDEFNLSALPSMVRELHLRDVRVTGDQFRHLEKLVISGYTMEKARQILTKLVPEHLCFNNDIVNTGKNTTLVDLIQCEFKSIVLGSIFWRDFKTNELSSYVDEEGEYYIFQNQRGTRINNEKFYDYFKFPPIER